jgi:hypothetical protein
VSTDAIVPLFVASAVQNVDPGTCACVTNMDAAQQLTAQAHKNMSYQ